jgi:hypothetical protein
MSLRAELIGETPEMPGFAVLLPEGWEAADAGLSGLTDRYAAVLEGFPDSTRTAVRARIESMLATARVEAAKADIVRVFAPSGLDPEEYVPVSLVASWLTAPSGGSIQDVGAGLIAQRGATPLDAGASILRWSLDTSATVEGGEVEVAGNGYLLPVPGKPQRALMFRSQILRSAAGAIIPDEGIAAMSLVCDAIVASVRWRRAA